MINIYMEYFFFWDILVRTSEYCPPLHSLLISWHKKLNSILYCKLQFCHYYAVSVKSKNLNFYLYWLISEYCQSWDESFPTILEANTKIEDHVLRKRSLLCLAHHWTDRTFKKDSNSVICPEFWGLPWLSTNPKSANNYTNHTATDLVHKLY